MFVVLKQKSVVLVLLLLIVAQAILTVLLCARLVSDSNVSYIDFTVVIDAGHGGVDGGVVANGVKESDLNLQYSQTLGEYFAQRGFNVVYTRKTNDGLYGLATNGFKMRDMLKRKEIIQEAQPNLVISVHMNRFASSARSGPQVFFQEDAKQGQLLAQSMQRVFNSFTGNRHEAIAGNFFICRESPSPAVIVECGFLSNPDEALRLQTEQYRQTLCSKIFEGVMLYLYEAS